MVRKLSSKKIIPQIKSLHKVSVQFVSDPFQENCTALSVAAIWDFVLSVQKILMIALSVNSLSKGHWKEV